jgi:hypothetical protein
VVTHRVFRAVEGKLRERFPTPEWLRKQYEEETRRRDTRSKPKAQEVIEKVAEVTTSGVRGEGAKQVASGFPTAAVVVSGVLLGVGTAAALAWAASAENRKGRP